MPFQPGDTVIHKSAKKIARWSQVLKVSPSNNKFGELANLGFIADGSYYCTWISGTKKGEGCFQEIELQLQ